MSLRFTDTAKWRDPWFMGLAPTMKLLWQYLCDNCDNAGVWAVSVKLAECEIGESIDWKGALVAFEKRVVPLDDGRKWHLLKFVLFQHPRGVNTESWPHIQVRKELAKHGLLPPSQEEMEGGGGYPTQRLLGRTKAKAKAPPSSIFLKGSAEGKLSAAALLAEFGLRTSPNAAREWSAGLNKIAVVRSLDEARAFMRFAITTAQRQGERIEFFRHAKLLAEEWNRRRNELWREGA